MQLENDAVKVFVLLQHRLDVIQDPAVPRGRRRLRLRRIVVRLMVQSRMLLLLRVRLMVLLKVELFLIGRVVLLLKGLRFGVLLVLEMREPVTSRLWCK